MKSGDLTVRVYGLLRVNGSVLVSDEVIKGQAITKFPGGGLQFGEGLMDALVREIREEMRQEARDLEHFYTTDFFQQSTFHSHPMQVISVYYTFRVRDPLAIPVARAAFGGRTRTEGPEIFRWLGLKESSENDVTLPIDRVVLCKLKGIDRSHA